MYRLNVSIDSVYAFYRNTKTVRLIRLSNILVFIRTFSSVASGELSTAGDWVVDGTAGDAVVVDPFPPKFNLKPGLNGLMFGLSLLLYHNAIIAIKN